MANRFWVGGAGTWDATSTTHWSATTGGGAGASAPTSSDAAIFDALSDAGAGYTVTIGTGATCASFAFTGDVTTTYAFGTNKIVLGGSGAVWTVDNGGSFAYTGTPRVELSYTGATGVSINSTATSGGTETNIPDFYIVGAGSYALTFTSGSRVRHLSFDNAFTGSLANTVSLNIYGDLTLSSAMTITTGTGVTGLRSTSGTTRNITSNGITFAQNLTANGVGGTFKPADNLKLGVTNTLTFTNGTFDANGKDVEAGLFALGSGTKTVTMGSGLWTASGTGTVWNFTTNAANTTHNINTANILLSDISTSARTFSATAPGAVAYNKLTIGGATGISTLTFAGAGLSFTELASTKTVAHTIKFGNGLSYTITTWSVTGTSGNVVTISSVTNAITATVAITNKTGAIDYLNIRDIISTTVAPVTFYAGVNSTYTSNNKGILFVSGTGRTVYILDSGTDFLVPADWNSADNHIHCFGGGGGGATSAASGNNRAGGGAGGGGGYRYNDNYAATPGAHITYAIGAAGAIDGDAGDTTWDSGGSPVVAIGGKKGTATTTPTSTGGAGGTAGTGGTGGFAGGQGGAGSTSTAANTGEGGGGGGGAAGPNGAGKVGGVGFASSTAASIAGGGGGGNGGGAVGTNGAAAAGGDGGNNSAGAGGATANQGIGNVGGGGGGGVNTSAGGSGGSGIDILGGVGGAGGDGGSSNVAAVANAGLYGGGGSGGGMSTAGVVRAGGAGSGGAVVVVYTPQVPATIAANENTDTAAVTAENPTQAQLAATETSDATSLTAANWITAQIAANEASDTASVTASVTTGAAVVASDSSDTAAVTVANWITAHIAATEGSDAAAIAATVTTGATIAAAESPDVAVINATEWTIAQIVATEESDTAAISTQVTTGAAIAANESSDNANIIVQSGAGTFAAIAATESSDVASIAADIGAPVEVPSEPGGGSWAHTTDWKPRPGTIFGRLRATEEPDTARFTGAVFTAVLRFEKPIGKFVANEEADGMAATGFMLDLVADDNDFLMMA